jgi:ferredoxin
MSKKTMVKMVKDALLFLVLNCIKVTPCQTCANECMVDAIHPEGNINDNECMQCLHCQVLYKDHDSRNAQ